MNCHPCPLPCPGTHEPTFRLYLPVVDVSQKWGHTPRGLVSGISRSTVCSGPVALGSACCVAAWLLACWWAPGVSACGLW